MKNKEPILLLVSLAFAARALAEPAWAYVPSSLETRRLEAIAVPSAPTEAAVTLVGARPASGESAGELKRVYAVDIDSRKAADDDGRPQAASTASAIPEGALWPDASGRIIATVSDPAGPPRASGIRNPWEVRVHPRPAGNDTVFACGGIVVGGEGGPIALLNGSIVKKGDTLGKFRVAAVLSGSVLLGKGGTTFVIPLGKSVTVSTVDG
jgi:hypothetical protein